MERVKLSWNKDPEKIIDEKMANPAVLAFSAGTAERYFRKFTPYMRGGLANSAEIYEENGRGVIHYKSPYAHYQYTGKLMVDSKTGSAWARKNTTKMYTDKELKYSKGENPLATSEWDKASLAVHKQDIYDEVQAYINRGGK